MKKILLKLIKKYQNTNLAMHSNCKYIPTCSNYAITVIDNFGAFKGSLLTLKRFIKCNPFSKGGIDLPPVKENKNETKK